jgi:DNA-directed RNA polymerase subunit RPC12/RpoP
MKFTTSFTIKTSIKCPTCQTKFPAAIDKARKLVEGQCPTCGKTVSVPSSGLAAVLSGRLADAGTDSGNTTTSGTAPRTISHGEAVTPAVDGRMKRVALGCNVVGGLVAAWTILYPRPYRVAIIVSLLLPMFFLVVLRVGQGAIRLVESKKDGYPHLSIGTIGSMLALALRGAFDFTLESYQPLLNPLCAFTLAMTLLIWLAASEVRENFWKLLLLLPVVFAFGYGAVIEANCLMDVSTPVFYDLKVPGKRMSSGRRSRTYYLIV